MAFIRYVNKPGGAVYASVVESVRVDGAVKQRTLANLGRVVDKERNVYRSRERGMYHFTLEEGYGPAPAGFEDGLAAGAEKEILDFGDAYAVWKRLQEDPMLEEMRHVSGGGDTLACLVLFHVLCGARDARLGSTWLQGTWAREQFGADALAPDRVAALLRALDGPEARERFFGSRVDHLREENEGIRAVICIQPEEQDAWAAGSGHSAALIAVSTENEPLYARRTPDGADPGGVAEAVTLLRAHQVPVLCAVLPEAFAHADQMKALSSSAIPFLIRLSERRRLHAELLAKAQDSLASPASAVRSGNSLFHVACERLDCYEEPTWAYACLDVDARHLQYKRAMFEAMEDRLSLEETNSELERLGTFVLLSSREWTPEEALSLLGMARRAAPLAALADTLTDFMAGLVERSLARAAEKAELPGGFRAALLALRSQKCRVLSNTIVPLKPDDAAKAAYCALGVECPDSLPPGPLGMLRMESKTAHGTEATETEEEEPQADDTHAPPAAPA